MINKLKKTVIKSKKDYFLIYVSKEQVAFIVGHLKKTECE